MSSEHTSNRASNNQNNARDYKSRLALPNDSDDSQLSDEDDSLLRLSQQAQHRKLSQLQLVNEEPLEPLEPVVTAADSGSEIDENEDFHNDPIIEEEDEDEEDDDDDDGEEESFGRSDNERNEEDELEMLETADFLRQLMQARRVAEINSGSGDDRNINRDSSSSNEEQRAEGI